jgi:hypothetical protein
MKTVRWMKIIGVLLISLGVFKPVHSRAQIPPFPTDPYLDSWSFYDPTNWLSDFGYAPIGFTNIVNDDSCWASDDGFLDCNGLILDSTDPAFLNYKVVESDGNTNLICSAGTIWFWFSPDWGSTNLGDGSTGPGDWGRFVDVGAWTSNADYGWWSLYTDPAGDNIYFSGQTNGAGTNYLNYPISWTANSWHLIGLTYTATNSILYVDGQFATNGIGVSYWPGHDVLTNGFWIGSDFSGIEQAHGEFVDVESWSDIRGSNFFSNYYNHISPELPGNGGFRMDDPGIPGGGGGGGGGDYSPDYGGGTNIDYGTNLWLWIGNVSSNLANLALVNTTPDTLFEIQGRTNLVQGNWISEGFVYGPELTNWIPMNVVATNRGTMFYRIRSWQDSTGSGIPDWWWLTYFGQVTNVNPNASAAGDGYSNLQKFQLGLNPTNYYNPNPPSGFFGCLDASGTNAFIEWSNAPGPVINYSIQRGIQDTNGNYVYTQIGLVSSNATFFEDVGAITNANAQNNIYNLEAVYPGGSYSATNSWTVWWYPNDGSYGPPYGPPTPSSFYAYADATGTNVLLSWIPAQGAATNYIISYGIYNPTNYAYQYTQITNVSPSTTNFEVFGALTNSSNWAKAYQIQAVYPGGGLSFPVTTLPDYYSSSSSINVGANTNAPAAPGNFYGYPDSTGTNIFLTWSPVSGSVTNYIIYGGVLDSTTGLIIYKRLAKLGSSTNLFEVVGAVDGSGNNLYYIYNVVAVYTNNSLSQSAAWYPGNGAPAPGALSAYVDATGTNVVLAWTPAQGAVTGYLIQVSDYYGESWSYSQLTNVNSTTFSFTDVNGVGNADYGLDAVVYEVQATYPNGGSSPAVTATVTTNAPAPSNLSATVDSTGTNVFLTWSPAVGVTTGYTVLRGTFNSSTGNYSYSTIGTVGSGTTSFADVGADVGGNANNDIYEVEADYAGGSLSSPVSSAVAQSSTPPAYNIRITAYLIRNATGRWQVMFSGFPTNGAQTIQMTWSDPNSWSDGNYNTTGQNISTSTLTNGIYQITDNEMVALIGYTNTSLSVQLFGPNGEPGQIVQAGTVSGDAPYFVDGRQHMKQNLNFLLRAASRYQPFGVFIDGRLNQSATNFEEFSFLYHNNDYYGNPTSITLDNLWPFSENYGFANYLVNTNRYDQPYGNTNFNFSINFANNMPGSPILNANPSANPYGTLQPGFLTVQQYYYVIPISLTNNSGLPWGITLSSTQTVASLQSGLNNVFGLPFQAGTEIDFDSTTAFFNGLDTWLNPGIPIYYQSLSPGNSVTSQQPGYHVGAYASGCPVPTLLPVNYYFAPLINPNENPMNLPSVSQQPFPLPIDDSFNVTNHTPPVIVGSVGQPMILASWEKYSISNSSPTKYAYLGQYFTNAVMLDSSGNITTNSAGILSPYGEFFPTQSGQAALITMPDTDTGQQGTGVVDIVSLNADANHDGTMNLTYNSPDSVSSSKPFRFWANDDTDWSDTTGTGIPGQGANGDGVKQIQNTWEVHGRRDLVDFFPVCLNIGSLFQSNALSAGLSVTDTNYQFVLSQADGALRFAYTDLTPTNYMNFLRDTNESGSLAFAPLTTISANGVTLTNTFVNGIATNNQNIILVEAWESTTQPLVLSVYKGSNLVAQTQLYLSISSVEQMFRYKNLLLITDSRAEADRLTDADVPNEPDTTNKNVVFVHGYNVNPTAARGWFADIYKRLYWSGSHAKFYGVTWEGYDSQGSIPFFSSVTPNYQTNVVRAFQTAPLLASFIATLTNGPTVAMAHSLGNMVTLSALSDYTAPISQYFMLDAAVPIEAIDGSLSVNTNMVFSTPSAPWLNYATGFWASKWFNVWPTSDARNTLTWSNRLANFGSTAVYNFYSSGEEVLRTQVGAPPGNLLTLFGAQLEQYIHDQSGTYVWAWQEKLKGQMSGNSILSSDHGGWGLNNNLNSGYVYFVNGLETNKPPTTLTNSVLQTNAFFNMDVDGAMFTVSSSGSTYAQTNRNRILSDAIPAVTLPIGANQVPRLEAAGREYNMQDNENNWPPIRLNQIEGDNWHHSDIRVVAYTFTYQAFDELVTLGNLK